MRVAVGVGGGVDAGREDRQVPGMRGLGAAMWLWCWQEGEWSKVAMK